MRLRPGEVVRLEDDPVEQEIRNIIKDNRAESTLAEIARILAIAGYCTRNNKPFTISQISKIARM